MLIHFRFRDLGASVKTRSQDELLDVYEQMITIRQVELRLSRLFSDGEVPGFIHLSIGQEAVATGVSAVLRPEDTVASTHRGHGHALAKGIDIDAFFLELMAREEGMCKGRGGSMHVANMALGMLGANAIVGAGIPIALGSALAHQVRKTGSLAIAFFGDGAMAEGVLHESMNLAALWRLPLLFVCENNGWAEFSPTHKQFVAPLDKLSAAFAIPHERVDGNDVLAVMDAAGKASSVVRSGAGPRVLECMTHRWHGHYEGDPQKYRPDAELEELDSRDPVPRFEAALRRRKVKKATIAAIRERVEKAVEQAVSRARQGSAPEWSAAYGDVYTDPEVA